MTYVQVLYNKLTYLGFYFDRKSTYRVPESKDDNIGSEIDPIFSTSVPWYRVYWLFTVSPGMNVM